MAGKKSEKNLKASGKAVEKAGNKKTLKGVTKLAGTKLMFTFK